MHAFSSRISTFCALTNPQNVANTINRTLEFTMADSYLLRDFNKLNNYCIITNQKSLNKTG